MPEYIRYDLQGYIIQKWYSVDQSVVAGLPDILEIPRDIFNFLTKYHKVDNGTVREMTQVEKNTLDATEAQALADAENTRITDLDDKVQIDLSGINLAKIDAVINNIGNLADAKNFLKKLCRYIIKFTAR